MELDYDRFRTRKRFENIRGSSRVGSEGLRDLPGWVGLGQEAFKDHGVGPGQPDTILPARRGPAGSKP